MSQWNEKFNKWQSYQSSEENNNISNEAGWGIYFIRSIPYQPAIESHIKQQNEEQSSKYILVSLWKYKKDVHVYIATDVNMSDIVWTHY